jgi:hypothetical protein
MKGRIIASIAFLVGGALTWYLLSFLQAFAHAEAGMSAGPIPAPSSADALIPWFLCAYFVVSAVSVLVAQKQVNLWLAAVLSHSTLVIAYYLICSEAAEQGQGGLHSAALRTGSIMAIFYSPWISIWVGLILGARKITA